MNHVNITLNVCGLIITIVAITGLLISRKILKQKHILAGAIAVVAFLGVLFDLLTYAPFWSDKAFRILTLLSFISILLWSGNLAIFLFKEVKEHCRYAAFLRIILLALYAANVGLYLILFFRGMLFTQEGNSFYPGDGLLFVTVSNILLNLFLIVICVAYHNHMRKYYRFIFYSCLTTPMVAVLIDYYIPGITTAFFLCDLCALGCFFVLYAVEITESNIRLTKSQSKTEELAIEQEAQIEEITELNERLNASNGKLAEVYGMIEGLSSDYYIIWLVDRETLNMKLMRTTLDHIQGDVLLNTDDVDYETAINSYISKYVAEEDRERLHRDVCAEKVLKQLETEKIYSVNYFRRDIDGNEAYHQMAFANANSEDGSKRFVLGLRDIDSVLRAEEESKQELREARLAAEAANRSKTIFLNNLSHDIRTPMNAIMGYTQLIQKNPDDPSQVMEHLSKIEKSGDYLLTIINNVLELARIDSGKEEVDEAFVDLMDESCSVVPLLENELKLKNLDFKSEMKNVTHRYVFADMNKIREITMNLMSNAIKYTPEGGSVRLTFEEVPSLKPGYATYVNSVSDTGIGMSEEFRQIIFDAFSRERNTTESKIMGTGLGMSIVKKLVEMMDGRIQVESELGKGTTFRVILSHRIVDSPEKYRSIQQDKLAKATIRFEGERVLLAEDNDLNAEIATAILEDSGLKVERASDGVVCLDMLSKSEPGYYDIILMDVQMPNMNGYQATDEIRKMPDNIKAAIPIVAMTANAFEEDKKEAIDAGMNGHISKPINVSRMLQTISELIHK